MTLQPTTQITCPTIAPATPQASSKNPTIAPNQPSNKLRLAYPIVTNFESVSTSVSGKKRVGSDLSQGREGR